MMARLIAVFLIFAGLLFAGPVDPPKGAKCVVCGMDVNMDPKFTSQLELKDGTRVYTESPKHAIQYMLKNKDKVKALWVRDFDTGKWIDGKKAYYVMVENGPMGMDVVAFRSKLKAKKFAKGRKVLRLSDIDMDFIKHLDQGQGHGKGHGHMH